jgi:DNA excision repair protein ERCC-3
VSYNPTNPLIIQSDKSVLLEVNNPLYEAARDELSRFAELEKSPEYIHTYRITLLSLWNAAAAGVGAEHITAALEQYSKFPVPPNIVTDIKEYISRYGRIKLLYDDGKMVLRSEDKLLMLEVERHKALQEYIIKRLDEYTIEVNPARRGYIKQALVHFGYPAQDLAGYTPGMPLEFTLRPTTISGRNFDLRDYQTQAVDSFYAGGSYEGGSGVVVLPCGAGKTVVGIGVMNEVQCHTLILTPSTIAVRQWINEILDKTNLTPDQVGEYTGEKKEIRPVTVTTYQVMTYRPHKVDKETGEVFEFPHMSLFTQHDWGLIVYDEVHLLPAPVFRATAEIQARRRLGLTATLVREDGHETDVFSLIGPKKYDMPWKELEQEGWIATAECFEIRVELPQDERMTYVLEEDNRIKYHISAVNSRKYQLLLQLVERHKQDHVLIIGQYIEQLNHIAKIFGAPLITGKTPNQERSKLYAQFKTGEIKLLVVSRVANFAIDLPDANVAIQVSGLFGSRQEEAQRLGRILRPKSDGQAAYFYSLVTRDTKDQDFAANRQLFLTEQGYRYTIMDASEVLDESFGAVEGQYREILSQAPALPSGKPDADGKPHLALVENDPSEAELAEAEATRTLSLVPLNVPSNSNDNGKKDKANGKTKADEKDAKKRSHLRVVK